MSQSDASFGPIPYGRQQITEADIEAVSQTLRSDYLTTGPTIQAFEQAFAQYIGAPYAIAVSSGTAALHLCTLALGVNAESRVITCPNTFSATANCVLYAGGQVDLVDIHPETLVMDPDLLEAKLSAQPRGYYQGIIPIDFAGYPTNLKRIRALADAYGCWIIEDACHAPGGYFREGLGSKHFCGDASLADLAIFSFHPVKHIACGEGGMITTANKALYEQICILRTHGITRDRSRLMADHGGWYYEMQMLGYNYRLSDIHASLGISQLKRVDQNLARRRALAQRYDAAFAGTVVKTAPKAEGHAYHLYVIQVPQRKALYDHLRSRQIYVQIHYIPVHFQPYYQQLGWKEGDFPATEKYYQHCISLPLYPDLTEAQQDFVIAEVLNFLEN